MHKAILQVCNYVKLLETEMKFQSYCLATCLGISSTVAVAQNCAKPHHIIGYGYTQSDMLKDAFKKAIQQEGLIILSEQQVRGFNLVKDDIFAYSANYIDSYKIIGGGYRDSIEIKACVSSTKIANRILSAQADTKQYDGQQASAQIQTFTNSLDNAKTLFGKIFQQYPKNAYNAELKKWWLVMDQQGFPQLNIHYRVTWNRNFLDALQDAVKATSLNDDRPHVRYTWVSGISFYNAPDDNAWFLKTKTAHYVYGDFTVFNDLRNKHLFSPYLVIELMKDDQVLYRGCRSIHARENFYAQPKWNTGYDINYHASREESFAIKDGTRKHDDALKNANQISLRIDNNICGQTLE